MRSELQQMQASKQALEQQHGSASKSVDELTRQLSEFRRVADAARFFRCSPGGVYRCQVTLGHAQASLTQREEEVTGLRTKLEQFRSALPPSPATNRVLNCVPAAELRRAWCRPTSKSRNWSSTRRNFRASWPRWSKSLPRPRIC